MKATYNLGAGESVQVMHYKASVVKPKEVIFLINVSGSGQVNLIAYNLQNRELPSGLGTLSAGSQMFVRTEAVSLILKENGTGPVTVSVELAD